MIHLQVSLLMLFSFHCSALPVNNGSLLLPRTFSGRYVTVTSEPFAYDPSALDDEDDEEGSSSGAEPEPVRSRDLRPRKQLVVSEETRAFLQGPLSTSLVPTVYSLVFVVSVPLNLVAVLMFSCHVRPKKPAVIYMLNLACCDLLFGLLLPFKIAYHYGGNDWTYGPGLCAAVTAAFYCNMYCSVLLVTCISVDRFLAVVFPMNSLTWRSPGTAWAVCVAMWLLALGGALPLLVSGQTNRLADLGITTCHDVQDEDSLRDYYLYFFPVYSAVFFFVPLVGTVVCYARIIHVLAAANVGSRSRKESWQKYILLLFFNIKCLIFGDFKKKRKTRAVVMAAVVLVVFVVCFTPTNVILMVHYAGQSGQSADVSYQAYLLSTCIGSVSCCLDPVLYYFGSSQCQKKVAALLGCRRPTQASKSCGTESTKTSRWTDSSRSRMTESMQSDPRSRYSKLTATWKKAS